MGAIEKAIARFNVASSLETDQTGTAQTGTTQSGMNELAALQADAAPLAPTGSVQPVAAQTANPAQATAARLVPAEAPRRAPVTQPVQAAVVASPAVQLVSGEDDGVNKNFKLPYKAMELEGLLSLTGPRNQMSEEYRAIKRPVLAAIDAQGQTDDNSGISRNVVMVTSCVSGEGKTFSAINLALSIALEKDREVLLVDGDITNPSCGKRLGFDDQPGLTELLQNSSQNPEELIWQSDLENFRFMPAGLSNNHATELLSSRNMSALVRELSQDHPQRVVIFDSAPLLLTSEASIVADLAGQIVFVVSAESTTKGMVSDAMRIVTDHSRVGFVLNKTRKSQNNIYGYGYGYGYGNTG